MDCAPLPSSARSAAESYRPHLGSTDSKVASGIEARLV